MKNVNFVIEKGVCFNKEKEMILCECILTVSKEQIINHLRTFDSEIMQRVDKALEVSLAIGVNRREELLKN